MHQALYRKWRPRSFDEVCGQDHITSVLRYEIRENAVSHAYLFCGSRGTGKTTCAKILAKAVNCLSPKDGNPCGECAACKAIDSGAATDVLEMDAASNNGVENIRDIRDEVVYSPSTLRYRVYIVDEVHMLSPNAFNALLKTLEEPPAHVVFILATTELQKLPATIISRCQRFDFRRIASPVLAARITHIANCEGLDLTPAAADRIARIAQGGMRDAISLLELCAGARGQITPETVNEMTGSTGRDSVIGLSRAIATGDFETVFDTVAAAVASSRDLSVFWQDLMSLYRDLLVVKTVKAPEKYLDLTDAETAELTALAALFRKGQLLFSCKLLEQTYLAMQKAGAVKRILAELTLTRLCDPALDTTHESLLARIEHLEALCAGGAALPARAAEISPPTVQETREKNAPTPPLAPIPEPTPSSPVPPSPVPPTPAVEAPRAQRVRGFAGCVERICASKAMYGAFLNNARAFLEENGNVLIKVGQAFHLSIVDTPECRTLLSAALSSELKREIPPSAISFVCALPEEDEEDTGLDDLLRAASDSE